MRRFSFIILILLLGLVMPSLIQRAADKSIRNILRKRGYRANFSLELDLLGFKLKDLQLSGARGRLSIAHLRGKVDWFSLQLLSLELKRGHLQLRASIEGSGLKPPDLEELKQSPLDLLAEGFELHGRDLQLEARGAQLRLDRLLIRYLGSKRFLGELEGSLRARGQQLPSEAKFHWSPSKGIRAEFRGARGAPIFECQRAGAQIWVESLKLQGAHPRAERVFLKAPGLEAGLSRLELTSPLRISGGEVQIGPDVQAAPRALRACLRGSQVQSLGSTRGAAQGQSLEFEKLRLRFEAPPPLGLQEIDALEGQLQEDTLLLRGRLMGAWLQIDQLDPLRVSLRDLALEPLLQENLLPLPEGLEFSGGLDLELLFEPSLEKLQLKFRLWEARLIHPGLAPEPLGPSDLRGDLLLQHHGEAWRLPEGRLERGALRLNLKGSLKRSLLKLKLSLLELECQAALQSLPPGLLGPYSEMEMKGRFSPKLSLSLPLKRPWELEFELKGLKGRCPIQALKAAKEAWPLLSAGPKAPDDVNWLNEEFLLQLREGVSRPVTVGPGSKGYIPLKALPPYVGGVAYLSEQMGFYRGWAISPTLIKRGLRMNLREGRFVYGGSTVSQQLVKNLFLSREKSLARKLREALIAGRMQDQVLRKRILELYLNCIEFGPNIYGVGAAARYYFQKDARKLSPREAIFLAMLKPAPWQGPMFKKRGQTSKSPWWTERVKILRQRLLEAGYLSESAAQADEERGPLRWDAQGQALP